MAIKNVIINNSLTDIISGTSSSNPANVGIYLCNFTYDSEVINLYIRETGEYPKNKNTILSDLLMLSGDTFHFPYEKFILGKEDTITASGLYGNRVSATVTYLNI